MRWGLDVRAVVQFMILIEILLDHSKFMAYSIILFD
jgi:hypothetical protein